MRYLNLLFCALAFACNLEAQTNTNAISREAVIHAEKLIGLEFTDAKRDLMLPGLKEQLDKFDNIRKVPLPNRVPPAILFNPIPPGMKFESVRKKFKTSSPDRVKMPADTNDLAFYSIGELAALIKSRQITSEKLTRFYLKRLKRYGPKLECVVTLTEELALQQARRLDAEFAAGKYRGPLHGIPYGAKDLLATKGIKTTWGSSPYKEQIFDFDATVIKRLEEAGAVLVAKTALGELAWGEVWYGGMTRNPWNLNQGSSGSSAGSAAATAAGLIAFGIGSETWGSIVSPCDRCGVTGLRPSYGRVSRAGAMALSWSMDKIGTICRTVEDCAIVFKAIYGPDGLDQTLYEAPFNYRPKIKLARLKVGYLKAEFEKEAINKTNDEATLAKLRELGATLIPIELPKYPIADLSFILSVEAAAAFDELTRSGGDDLMVRQIRASWPNVFREARFVPAVEYIQANRIRCLLIREMAQLFDEVDIFLAPSLSGDSGLLTNLTGHPCVVVPNGFSKNGMPTSICIVGKLFGEAELLAAAKLYQDATAFHREHPGLGR